MSKLIGLLCLGLAGAPCLAQEAEARTPLTLEPDLVSDSCETLFKAVKDSKGTQLQFNPTTLSSDGLKSLTCKITWKPSIPANRRLLSAVLQVEGHSTGGSDGGGIIRLGHKMLGTGRSPGIVTHKLETGAFDYKMQIQNLESNNCGAEAKIITTVSFLVAQMTKPEGDTIQTPASITLKTITLMPLELEDCPTVAR